MFIDANWISLFIGIVSGILTTVILWLISILFKNVFIPYFEQLIYKGVNISGDWVHSNKQSMEILTETSDMFKNLPADKRKDVAEKFGLDPESEDTLKISTDFEIFLHIEQKSHQISGYFNVKSGNKSNSYTNLYKIKGEIKDNYVIFNYMAERSDRTGIGSFILRVANGGTKLLGSAIFTPDGSIEDTKVVVREEMDFERK